MIKHPLGLLYVMGMALFWALVATLCVVTVISFYGLLFLLLAWIMAKSYVILGDPWFFIVWTVGIVGFVNYKLRHWWKKFLFS